MPGVSLENLSPEAIADLALTLKGLTDNPKTRAQTLYLMKVANPELAIPEVDIPAQMSQLHKASLERLEKLERSIQEKEAREKVLDARNSVLKKGIISEDEIPEVEKLMLEKGITSHETAAEFFASQKRAAEPTPGQFGKPLLQRLDMKAMSGNINQWARDQARAVIDEMRGKRTA